MSPCIVTQGHLMRKVARGELLGPTAMDSLTSLAILKLPMRARGVQLANQGYDIAKAGWTALQFV
jgi:hypothetical protein